MSVDSPDPPVEVELDARLRRTLSQVASTIGDTTPASGAPLAAAASAAARRPPRRRWRPKLVAIGVALAAVSLAGFAYLQFGPEYVTEHKLVQLQQGALAAGGTKPNRYWLVASFHTDSCGRPMPGVELVAESANQVGTEWSTGGVFYGEASFSRTNGPVTGATSSGCLRYDERAWLKAPRRFALGVTRLGQPAAPDDGDWALLAAVHPSVHGLRITTPGSPTRTIATVPRADRPNGPRYAVIVLPATATQVQLTLLDAQGDPVAGGIRNLTLGR
jgi:hypothetical protein